jgi:hypothetical protein
MESFPSRGDLPQLGQESEAETPADALTPPAAPTELKGLKAFARPGDGISPAEPTPAAQASADSGSEPDWLSATSLSEEPTVQGIATDDLDWLSAAMPETPVPESTVSEPPTPTEAEPEIESFFASAEPVSSTLSDEADLDWLAAAPTSEPSPEPAVSLPKSASDEADLDWLDSALTATADVQESTPIKSIKRLPKADDVPAAEQSDQPRTIKKLPKTEEQPAVRTIKKLPTTTPEASSYEDWERAQIAAEQPAQSAESLTDEVPDWFKTAGAPAAAPADDVPDWFKSVQQPAQAAAQSQPEPQDDVPDWFRNMDVASTPLAGPVQAPTTSAPPAPTEDVPDWFKGTAAAGNQDFNTMFGASAATPAAPEPVAPVTPAASEGDALDWMTDLPDTANLETSEPVLSDSSATSADAEDSDTPAWMRDLGPTEPTPAVQAKASETTQEPELDWLSDIDESAFAPAAPQTPARQTAPTPEVSFTGFADLAGDTGPEAPVNLDLSGPVDIDALLKMAEEREGAEPAVYKPIPGSGPLPGTDTLDSLDDVDLDVLLGPLPGETSAEEKPQEALAADIDSATRITQEGQGEVPEWLAEIRPSEGPAVLRIGDQEVRIIEKSRSPLSDEMRLIRERSRAIRKRAADKPAEKPGESASPVAGPLAGIGGALDPFAEAITPGSTLSQPVITDVYARRVRLIQKILETEEQMLRDRALAEDVREAKQAAQIAKPAPQVRPRPKIDRLIITLLLAVAIVAPFFIKGLNIVPPLTVQLTTPQAKVAAVIDGLQPDQPVLVAFEYGPTAAGELDDMARVLLRDLIRRKVRPVIVSTNPAGAMHAQSLIAGMADSTDEMTMMARLGQPLAARQDYVVLRYLPGGAAGVRAMATALITGGLQAQIVFSTDIEGKPSGLVEPNITDLGRRPAFILTETPDDVRNWVEQYRSAPSQNPFPMILLSSASASATAEAYARSDTSNRIPGIMVGLRDALTYQAVRQAMPAGAAGDRARELVAQRWQSVGVSALLASAVIALGAVLNLIRALTRREPR